MSRGMAYETVPHDGVEASCEPDTTRRQGACKHLESSVAPCGLLFPEQHLRRNETPTIHERGAKFIDATLIYQLQKLIKKR